MASFRRVGRISDMEYYVQVNKDGEPITGEIKEVDVVIRPTSRNNFYITYLSTIIQMIDSIGNKKMEVVKYILKNMDSNNKLTETVDEIVKKSGISKATVVRTLQILEQANIVARKTGLVMLSPKIAHKGNVQKERYLMTKFEEIQGVQFVDFSDEMPPKATETETKKSA